MSSSSNWCNATHAMGLRVSYWVGRYPMADVGIPSDKRVVTYVFELCVEGKSLRREIHPPSDSGRGGAGAVFIFRAHRDGKS